MDMELHLITRAGDQRGWRSVAYSLGAGRRPVVVLAGDAVAESEESVRGLLGHPVSEDAMPILAVCQDAAARLATERWALVDYEALLDLLLTAEVVVAW